MLLSFRTANHRSLRTEQQLSLVPVYDADRPEGTRWEAVPVVGLFGANASGKSSLVEALSYMRELVLASDRLAEPDKGIARYTFALDPGYQDEPSWYIVDCTIDDVRHTYGFSLDSHKVLEEWLYWYPHKKRRIIFHRTGQKYRYGTKSSSSELPAAERLAPENILFISVAARISMPEVAGMFRWFRQLTAPGLRSVYNLDSVFRMNSRTRLIPLLENEVSRRLALRLLKFADFGIEDIGLDPEDRTKSLPSERMWLTMRGATSNARLRLEDQSAGTRTFLTHMPDVLSALTQGSVLVVDELESNLHPILAAQVVRLFQNSNVNQHGAQLIFTTHNTSTLASNGEILKRDQVWFVEKSAEDGSSCVYPLSAFKPRVEENTERRYLHGSYGAIPFVDEERANAVLAELLSTMDEGEE